MVDDAGSNRGDREEHLFTPSVERDVDYDPPPWNIASQVYVAFFGGVIAITAIAYLNALRLHAGDDVAKRFLFWGAAALAASLAVTYLIAESATGGGPETRTYVRLVSRVIAVVLHFVFAAQLKQADRRFQLADGDYESLWKPGLTAAAAGGIVQAILLYLVVGTT